MCTNDVLTAGSGNSNAGLISYLDWLFSAKETEGQKRAPGPGASPEFKSSSGKERQETAKPLLRLGAPWAGQAEPGVLLASPL